MNLSSPSFRLVAVALAAAAIGACLSVAPASAQQASGAAGGRGERMIGELKKRFDAADANHDGKLTKDEAKAGMPRIAEHFDEIDTAHTGAITMADIERWGMKQRAARKAAAS